MAVINPSIPVVGQPNSSEEPKIVTALTQLVGAVNNIDSSQIVDGTIVANDLATAVKDGYLKLATAADRKLNFAGGVPVPFFDSARLALTISHGLSVAPQVVMIQVESSGFAIQEPQVTTKTTSTFTVEIRRSDGGTFVSGNSVTIGWLAIG
jgi:hypothetical protein